MTVRWHIDTDEKTVSSGSREITGADLAAKSVNLLDFTPDTSSKRTYTITAELVKNDLVVMQASTNYFVSDKGVAIVTNTDKDCLCTIHGEVCANESTVHGFSIANEPLQC